jgi:hypothetical protein
VEALSSVLFITTSASDLTGRVRNGNFLIEFLLQESNRIPYTARKFHQSAHRLGKETAFGLFQSLKQRPYLGFELEQSALKPNP